MKTLRLSLMLAAACCLLIVVSPAGAQDTADTLNAQTTQNLSSSTLQQLLRARRATARYKEIAQAEADGYVNIDIYEEGEGLHYVNFSLVDGNFDPEHPEVLLYARLPHKNCLELVAVEYAVPLSLSPGPPSGFTGHHDVWRENSEGLGLWELNVWLWLPNSNGIFAFKNPRVP
jgi:hypothetical protein